jgi:GntR family transcriptional regulator, transcriptional repressor for pyruvate dehydrogenase complex
MSRSSVVFYKALRFKQPISEGTLTPGYKLPSERELSAHFGVSRTSLRPVMKILKMMGVVSQRVGDGTYLNGDAPSVLAEPMEFRKNTARKRLVVKAVR